MALMVMKKVKNPIVAILAAGLLLFGCSSESVAPAEGSSTKNPNLAGAVGDPHPRLDSVCGNMFTINLVSEESGSATINKCNVPGGMGPCTTTIPWGSVTMYNGVNFVDNVYDNGDDVEYFVADFSVASGWYIETGKCNFSVESAFAFTNGIPQITQDWFNDDVNPLVNKWQMRKRMTDLPQGGFSVALNLTLVKLNLYSQIVNGSMTSVWGKNPDWNNSASGYYSAASPFLTNFPIGACFSATWPAATNQCVSIYTGAPALGCAELTPSVVGTTGPVTYAWSNGATTSSINVCPTAATTYTVSVSDAGAPFAIVNYDVNVIDASCGNGNGNNPHHKVTVCHHPPGNPANVQNICIDWSGVPAHVARFRPAGSKQGHDSGCEIGACGSNPCLQ